MEYFDGFITGNLVFDLGVVAWAIAQGIKVLLEILLKGRSSWDTVFGTGGMPSSHSAVVCATAISCGILHGYDSAVFAVSAILAIVVMRDASGIRRAAGKQAAVINQISEELGKKKRSFKDITLPELLGHTPLQVLFGALLGFGMAYFCQRFLFIKIL